MWNTTDNISRRQFLKVGAGVLGASLLPLDVFGESFKREDPHFMLVFIVPGGMDFTYLFDARPLAMSSPEDGVLQNYMEREPFQWKGNNDHTTWATDLTRPLLPYKNDFSILNGVVMASSFDGHEQNLNYLMTGNPFGGENFLPHLNEAKTKYQAPVDYIAQGYFFGLTSTNAQKALSITPDGTGSLLEKLKTDKSLKSGSKMLSFFQDRMLRAADSGSGAFSRGSQEMATEFAQLLPLTEKLKGVNLATTGDAVKDNVLLACAYFREKIATGTLVSYTPVSDATGMFIVDAHDPANAKTQPGLYKEISQNIVKIIETLKATPYSATKSFYDVTTFMFTSEFGRTMRQTNKPINDTGTDHNSLSNTILIGGKGIRGGLVVGASDFQTKDEVLSQAHLLKDQTKVRMMGCPFDRKSLKPVAVSPKSFATKDYLSMPMVANTLYSMFGVSKDKYWLYERNGETAATLPGLMA